MGRPRRAPILLWLLVGGWPATAQDDPGPLEYRVKAGYLLNFARYVEWPGGPGAAEPLRICVLGEDPFGPVLDRAVEGRTVNGRIVSAERVPRAEAASGCQVVFVGLWDDREERAALAALDGSPVLTVGESSGFLERGGSIQFVTVEDTVRFEVNLAAAHRAGLKISSRMLSYARQVRTEAGERSP
ncbi:MAG TPA: YfiR family protein [Candidatus Polarisedimenticolia bacterium]|nr:YfiR family protein [Candidatus Polarisedimenticolia bacterium]